jgi:A/G-specific adenine glycosylase
VLIASHDSNPSITPTNGSTVMGLESIRVCLFQLGKYHDGRYPWHRTKDPFHILVAEYFLRRTTRTAVSRVFEKVVQRYPTLEAVALADPESLWEVARELGLKQRTMRLPLVAKTVIESGGLKGDRAFLKGLPSVGDYIADAIMLYAFGSPTFPMDSSVQRVLIRLQTGKNPKKNSNPYQDTQLSGIVQELVLGTGARMHRTLHQGVLYVAWSFCRPVPLCQKCPLVSTCEFGQGSLGQDKPETR